MTPDEALRRIAEREEWRTVIDWPDYEVSSTGQVRSRKSGRVRIRRQHLSAHRYHAVVLSMDGRTKRAKVAHLVARAFLGPRPADSTVNHKDGDRLNNHAANLEYITQGENNRHAYELGLRKKGEQHHSAKLSVEDIREIRRLVADGWTKTAVANRFGVTRPSVCDIIFGVTWRHVA